MAKWLFEKSSTWEYPALGFIASEGDVLEADFAPDPNWTQTDESAPETVLRINGGYALPAFVEPADGTPLVWDADLATAKYSTAPLDALTREAQAVKDYSKLLPWYAALANRRNSPVDVVMIGDSIVEGYGLSAFSSTLPQQLAASLRARLGVTSSGRGFIGPQSDTTNHAFWPMVRTGGTLLLGYGANDRLIQFNGAGQKVVITLPSGGVSAFDIVVFKSATGSATGGYYKIDGGSAVTFSVNNATTIVTTIRVNSAATSTIEVGYNAGSAWNLIGVTEYKSDESSGIHVHNCAVSGTTAANWNTYAPTGWPAAMALLNPDLVVINLGTNDSLTAAGNASAATFKTNLLALIANVRTTMTCPIVLSAAYNAQNGASAVEPWANYVAAMQEIADADSAIVLVDHSARMYAASLTDPAALYNASSMPHCTTKGYALMAETLTELLMPR